MAKLETRATHIPQDTETCHDTVHNSTSDIDTVNMLLASANEYFKTKFVQIDEHYNVTNAIVHLLNANYTTMETTYNKIKVIPNTMSADLNAMGKHVKKHCIADSWST